MLDNDYDELAVAGEHAAAVDGLPDIRKDPFYRMFVAQAMVEGATLLTNDPVVAQYPGTVRKI